MDWVVLAKNCRVNRLEKKSDISFVCQHENILVLGQSSGQILVFKVQENGDLVFIQQLLYHKHPISSVLCFPFEVDGLVDLAVLSLDESGLLCQWLLKSCKCRAKLQIHNGLCLQLFLLNTNYVCVCGTYLSIYIIQLSNFHIVGNWMNHDNWPIMFSHSVKSNYIPVGYIDGSISLWSLNWSSLEFEKKLTYKPSSFTRLGNLISIHYAKELSKDLYIFVYDSGISVVRDLQKCECYYYKEQVTSILLLKTGAICLFTLSDMFLLKFSSAPVPELHVVNSFSGNYPWKSTLIYNEEPVIIRKCSSKVILEWVVSNDQRYFLLSPSLHQKAITFAYCYNLNLILGETTGLVMYSLFDWYLHNDPFPIDSFPNVKGLVTYMKIFENDPSSIVLIVTTKEGNGYFYKQLDQERWQFICERTLNSLYVVNVVYLKKVMASKQSGIYVSVGLDGSLTAIDELYNILGFLPSDGAHAEVIHCIHGSDCIFVSYDNFQSVLWEILKQEVREVKYNPAMDASFISVNLRENCSSVTANRGTYSMMTDDLLVTFINTKALVNDLDFSNESYIEKSCIDEFLDFIQPPFLNSENEDDTLYHLNSINQPWIHLGVGKPDGSAIIKYNSSIHSVTFDAPFCSALLLHLYFALLLPVCKYDGLSENHIKEGTVLKLEGITSTEYSLSTLAYIWSNSDINVQEIIRFVLLRISELTPYDELQRIIHYFFEFFCSFAENYYLNSEVEHSLYVLSILAGLYPSAFDDFELKTLSSYLLEKASNYENDHVALRLLSNGFSVYSKHIDPAKLIYYMSLSASVHEEDLKDHNSMLFRSVVDVSSSNAILLLTCLCNEIYDINKPNVRQAILKIMRLAIENTEQNFVLFNHLVTEKLIPILYANRSSNEVTEVTKAISERFPFVCFDEKIEKYSYIENGFLTVYDIPKRKKIVSTESVDGDFQLLSANPAGECYVGVSAMQKECIIWKMMHENGTFLNTYNSSLNIIKRVLLQTSSDNENDRPEILWIGQTSAEIHVGSTIAIIDI
ncbi:WD repeat protein [Schizosaccharomyces cryophilus OY26]|uniref:WD repeat protein n=1 Tax=Schizosaccharomyces cryophilus (strain OY26 / ATCC MYA-4695 / CBS 11777 / NBRC 106824 / NRRL Y48691) TaxID=653667 RepID=S9W6S8_SCHCR|nr:WD repeat protein [Schizosaccharomyces cryophilus OY26]EPY54254.1 WD repeat protein [Schizosaccharomyces cryophilus OY26]